MAAEKRCPPAGEPFRPPFWLWGKAVGTGIILPPQLSSYLEARKGDIVALLSQGFVRARELAGNTSISVPALVFPPPPHTLEVNLAGTILEDLTAQRRVKWAVETGLRRRPQSRNLICSILNSSGLDPPVIESSRLLDSPFPLLGVLGVCFVSSMVLCAGHNTISLNPCSL